MLYQTSQHRLKEGWYSMLCINVRRKAISLHVSECAVEINTSGFDYSCLYYASKIMGSGL